MTYPRQSRDQRLRRMCLLRIIAMRDDDTSLLACKTLRRGRANPAAAADDQDNLVLEGNRILHWTWRCSEWRAAAAIYENRIHLAAK
jgi:hypothetical protein